MAKIYKGSWRRILDLPPIDWALLAAERSRGRRHTPATIKKLKAGIAKRNKAKRKRALASIVAAAKPIRKTTPGATARFLGAFVPGEWYGVSDIQRRTGLPLGTCKAYRTKFVRSGDLARTKNPAWERPGGFECEYLYRLNPQMHNDVGDQPKGAGDAE